MKFISVVVSIVLLSIGFVNSQTIYPPTINVPVTFYDFHADGSNPEFEPGLHLPGGNAGAIQGIGLHLNEVQDTLDVQRKPLAGIGTYFSAFVKNWFKPWQPGEFTIPAYNADGSLKNIIPVACDTSFKNVVIPDTLLFTLVPGSAGIYEFHDQNFFRLDGKAFGNEPAGYSHNYGFTMEMHWDFMYQKGLTFQFEGDDDLWVYINGRLAIDLGGIHGPRAASINLDTIPGLTTGKPYMLDVFYAQRHVPGSDIRITTDIIAVCPCEWELKLEPRDTIVGEGDSVVLHAVIMDDTGGIHPDASSLCEWSLSPATTASFLSTAKGGTTTFYANAADQRYSITAQYNGPALPFYLERYPDSIIIYVKPAPASNRLEQIPVSRSMEKSKSVREFYNLRGQKLQGNGALRVDGIVLERFIDQSGKVNVRREFQVPDSRMQMPQ